MKKIYLLGIVLFLSCLQVSTFAQSGFVNVWGSNVTNCAFSVGQPFASNQLTDNGYLNEGLQQPTLIDYQDTLLVNVMELPYTYRVGTGSGAPGVPHDIVFNEAGILNDTYILPSVGIDTLMDVAFYTVECPNDTLIIAPYSVCEIPVTPNRPIIKPDDSEPPVMVSNDDIHIYPCHETHNVHWLMTVADKSRTCDQAVMVLFPPCGEDAAYATHDTNYSRVVYPSYYDEHNYPFYAKDFEEYEHTTVRMGCYCWTKENLRSTLYSDGTTVPFARVHHSELFPDDAANLENFGRLYTWYSAVKVGEGDNAATPVADANGYVQGVCPEGWRVPSLEEMSMLHDNYDADDLKTADQWLVPGTNSSDFSATPAGFYLETAHSYQNVPGFTYFWTTHCGPYEADNGVIMYHCEKLQTEKQNKANGLSVRCIKN